jgi:cytochrome c-type biogenesis protein CcmH
VLAAAIVLASAPALAVRPDERLQDAAQEARAHAIGQELRCLVCQNESIEDSQAGLAHDLRLLVRQRILAGDSDKEVKQYIVARYGTYVLLKPPLNAETSALWFGPLLLLLCASGGAIAYCRRGALRSAQPPPPLSVKEERRLAVLMEQSQKAEGL